MTDELRFQRRQRMLRMWRLYKQEALLRRATQQMQKLWGLDPDDQAGTTSVGYELIGDGHDEPPREQPAEVSPKT